MSKSTRNTGTEFDRGSPTIEDTLFDRNTLNSRAPDGVLSQELFLSTIGIKGEEIYLYKGNNENNDKSS